MQKLLKGSNLAIGAIVLTCIALFFYIMTPTGGYKQDENHSTKIYFADNILPVHQRLIDRFNHEYQGKIEVVPINLPFTKFSTNERKELLARTLRSKSSRIDIFSVDIIWVPRFARWCHPLDSSFPQKTRNRILKYALESCQYENQLVAIPFYIDIGMMYYRQDILRTLPDGFEIEQELKKSISWENFIELNHRFSHLNNPFYLFAADNYEGLICSFVEGIASQNQSVFNSQSHKLNITAAQKTLQLLVDLIHKYQMTPAIVSKYDEFQCYLHALKCDGLFLRGWPGFLRHYRSELEDTSKFQYLKMAPLPHFQGGQPAFVFGGWNLMISKHSTKKSEAIKFIKFTQLPENQKMMYQLGGYLPIINTIYQDSLFLKQEPDLKFYRSLMEHGVHRPYMVDYTKISDIISYHLHLAIKKDLSVSEALERASQLINSKEVLIK